MEPSDNQIDSTSSILRNLMNEKINFLLKLVENTPPDVDQTIEPANEGVEVSYPYVPNPSYGNPVYSGVLLEHTFANSWEKPALVTFTPPAGVLFNKVVLTLNTSVGDYQYDRLAHLFVGGAEIWRTSTIEPNGGIRFSIFKKDVTPYASLFQTETPVLFQLDNIVSSTLKGAFDIQLSIDLYYSLEPALGSDDDTGVQQAVSLAGQYNIFSVAKPADKVYPLVESSSPGVPPLVDIPLQTFVVDLPTVPNNTTRLRLSVFTSGNGDEEFWYTNVLDTYANIYPNNTLLAHGPTRFINIYVDDQRIVSQTPHPVIFTGGISPDFWMPIVSNNAFDLKSYDVDVSGLLPYLWENSNSSSSHSLRIELSNGLDGEIGKDWTTSANLLAYESDQVVKSRGSVISIESPTTSNSVGSYEDDVFAQVVNAKLGGVFSSNLAFTLKSGTTINTTFKHVTHGEISNIQAYLNEGNLEYVTHVGHNHRHLSIVLATNDVIFELDSTVSFPFYNIYNQTNIGSISDADTEIINIKDTSVSVDGSNTLQVSVVQYALDDTSTYNKTRKAQSHSQTDYNLQISYPVGANEYSRTVKGSNESVTSDEISGFAGGFVDISSLDIQDTASYEDTKKFITSSFHGEYANYLAPIFEAIELSNIPNSLSSSHQKRSKLENNVSGEPARVYRIM